MPTVKDRLCNLDIQQVAVSALLFKKKKKKVCALHLKYYLLGIFMINVFKRFITNGDLKYRSFLFFEHSMNHLFLNGSLC